MIQIRDIHTVDATSYDYVYEENVSIPLQCQDGVVRCNVYRPKGDGAARYPVLVTYGPYGKDIHYSKSVYLRENLSAEPSLTAFSFHRQSYDELPQDQKSAHSAWETPDPGYWMQKGFAIVRADEVGLGQSPGFMDTMSASTSEAFKDVIEWTADQPWSTGKIGLLGISYYAGSQWRVAARQPKGLSCIIPWEGMSDYYRDRCRHGGILSNSFIDFWWNRQVGPNQYGLPGRAARKWGPDTIEGGRSAEELVQARRDQRFDNVQNRYLDDQYYASRVYDMQDIEVPLLSVGNWGGILLHLRGNIEGYMHAKSQHKYLRLITGRHDLPFYSPESVALQESFLNAFLKGDDKDGWLTSGVPRVGLVLRKGDVGYNNPEAEKAYPYRYEEEWPLARTKYVKYFLSPEEQLLAEEFPLQRSSETMTYEALGTLKQPKVLQFTTEPFERATEFTGHIVAHLNVSATHYHHAGEHSTDPMDIDIFLTIRHIAATGTEVLYTGTVGDPVPVTKGWLRCSLRKTSPENTDHHRWHPRREYLSTDVELLKPGQVCEVDVEIWPTNVIVDKGDKLVFEVSSGDTQGAGLFEHNSSIDRPSAIFGGWNHIHFGQGRSNWLLMPEIPAE